LALAEVAARDLNVAIVGQLAPPQLSLGDKLKASPLQVVRLKTFLGRHGAIVSQARLIEGHSRKPRFCLPSA
jgi:hypothetical protein